MPRGEKHIKISLLVCVWGGGGGETETEEKEREIMAPSIFPLRCPILARTQQLRGEGREREREREGEGEREIMAPSIFPLRCPILARTQQLRGEGRERERERERERGRERERDNGSFHLSSQVSDSGLNSASEPETWSEGIISKFLHFDEGERLWPKHWEKSWLYGTTMTFKQFCYLCIFFFCCVCMCMKVFVCACVCVHGNAVFHVYVGFFHQQGEHLSASVWHMSFLFCSSLDHHPGLLGLHRKPFIRLHSSSFFSSLAVQSSTFTRVSASDGMHAVLYSVRSILFVNMSKKQENTKALPVTKKYTNFAGQMSTCAHDSYKLSLVLFALIWPFLLPFFVQLQECLASIRLQKLSGVDMKSFVQLSDVAHLILANNTVLDIFIVGQEHFFGKTNEMKSAPRGLAGGREWSLARETLSVGGDRMTANALRMPTMRENQLLREEKKHFIGLCFNTFKHCALTCMHTQQQAMWRRLLEVETLPIDRSHDRTTHTSWSARSIARWNMKHFRSRFKAWSHCSQHCTALEDTRTIQSMNNAGEPSTWPRPGWERKR